MFFFEFVLSQPESSAVLVKKHVCEYTVEVSGVPNEKMAQMIKVPTSPSLSLSPLWRLRSGLTLLGDCRVLVLDRHDAEVGAEGRRDGSQFSAQAREGNPARHLPDQVHQDQVLLFLPWPFVGKQKLRAID